MSLRKLKFYLKCVNIYYKNKINKPRPFLVIIVPTKNCNQRCYYCEYYKRSKIDKQIMSLKFMKNIVDEVEKMGTPFISFSGGEPLLSNDIEKVLKYAHDKGIITNLGTNGLLLSKKRVIKILEYSDYIRFSIEGHNSLTHDKITGIKGSFLKTYNIIKYIKKINFKKSQIGINIVYDGNIINIEKIIKLFLPFVDFISILPRYSYINHNKPQIQKRDKKLFDLVNKYKSIINNFDFLSINNKNYKYYCDYGKLYLTVYPTGTVMGCPYITNPKSEQYGLGNINFIKLSKMQKNFKSIKNLPCQGCNSTCTTMVSKIFNQPLYKLLFNQLKKII
jgi:MoaA/NifB/PqqE/SkfB family radical SAM enzyme